MGKLWLYALDREEHGGLANGFTSVLVGMSGCHKSIP